MFLWYNHKPCPTAGTARIPCEVQPLHFLSHYLFRYPFRCLSHCPYHPFPTHLFKQKLMWKGLFVLPLRAYGNLNHLMPLPSVSFPPFNDGFEKHPSAEKEAAPPLHSLILHSYHPLLSCPGIRTSTKKGWGECMDYNYDVTWPQHYVCLPFYMARNSAKNSPRKRDLFDGQCDIRQGQLWKAGNTSIFGGSCRLSLSFFSPSPSSSSSSSSSPFWSSVMQHIRKNQHGIESSTASWTFSWAGW